MKTRLIVLALRGVQGLTALGAIALIGLVVRVAEPFAGRTECGGRLQQAQCDIKSIASMLTMHQCDTGEYPTTEEGLAALVVKPAHAPVATWKGPYLDSGEVQTDPWGNPYVYRYEVRGSRPELFSRGPDGVEGTEDDIRR